MYVGVCGLGLPNWATSLVFIYFFLTHGNGTASERHILFANILYYLISPIWTFDADYAFLVSCIANIVIYLQKVLMTLFIAC